MPSAPTFAPASSTVVKPLASVVPVAVCAAATRRMLSRRMLRRAPAARGQGNCVVVGRGLESLLADCDACHPQLTLPGCQYCRCRTGAFGDIGNIFRSHDWKKPSSPEKCCRKLSTHRRPRLDLQLVGGQRHEGAEAAVAEADLHARRRAARSFPQPGTERERSTERQRQRHTDTQTHWHTDTQTFASRGRACIKSRAGRGLGGRNAPVVQASALRPDPPAGGLQSSRVRGVRRGVCAAATRTMVSQTGISDM